MSTVGIASELPASYSNSIVLLRWLPKGLCTCGGLAHLSEPSHSSEIDSTCVCMKSMPIPLGGIVSSMHFEN